MNTQPVAALHPFAGESRMIMLPPPWMRRDGWFIEWSVRTTPPLTFFFYCQHSPTKSPHNIDRTVFATFSNEAVLDSRLPIEIAVAGAALGIWKIMVEDYLIPGEIREQA